MKTASRLAVVSAAITLSGCGGTPAPPIGTAGEIPPRVESTQTSLRFVTTRDRAPAGAGAADYFGNAGGALTYGRCVVEREGDGSRSRIDGVVEFLLPVRSAKLVALEEIPPDAFWRELEASLAEDPDRRIVLFVHGYAYGFARGCRRVSGFQQAVGDSAHVILFSWPSNGNPLDYADDRADLERSVPELAAIIHELAERFDPDRVALAAHSMGAVGIVSALARLGQAGLQAPVSADLVLLAPDHDVAGFLDRRALLETLIGRISVYVSDNDRLLGLSAWHNDEPRLGQGGEQLAVAPFFETIDVTAVGRYHPTGHEYHVFHPVVEADLIELLVHGTDASSRTYPVPATRDGQLYWRLVNEPVPDVE